MSNPRIVEAKYHLRARIDALDESLRKLTRGVRDAAETAQQENSGGWINPAELRAWADRLERAARERQSASASLTLLYEVEPGN